VCVVNVNATAAVNVYDYDCLNCSKTFIHLRLMCAISELRENEEERREEGTTSGIHFLQ
jgi:hypothetical protein